MVTQAAASRLRAKMASVFLTLDLTIQRQGTNGVWANRPSIRVCVQHEREDYAERRASEARVEAARSLRVYADFAADVQVGDRFLWSGIWYVVAAVTPDRGEGVYRRFSAEQLQLATRSRSVLFRRRDKTQPSGWLELGSFVVQFTEDSADPENTGRTFVDDAATAAGAQVRGSFAGGTDLLALAPGDWFEFDGMPGRVTSLDREAVGSITGRYTQERRGGVS